MEKILYCIRKKPLEEEDPAFYMAQLLITVSLSYKKSLVWHYIVKIGLTVLLLLIYLMLLIPFVLVFF